MLRNLPKIVDHYDDSGAFLKEAIDGNRVPDVVKTAADLSSPSSRNEEDYALVVNTSAGKEYKYPIVDAGNTLASAMYLSSVGSELPEDLRKTAAIKINEALKSFGFSPTEDLEKTAALELGYSGPGMETDRSLEELFNIRQDDPTEVLKDAFDTSSPRGKRRLMLQVKEAGLLEHLSQEVSDYSREKVGSDVSIGIDLRKLVLIDPEASLELDGIKEKSASAKPDDLAEEISDFDIRHGITHFYGKNIPDPYATVFGTDVEKNASTDSDIEIDGVYYGKDAVEGFAENKGEELADAFGNDFAEQFKQDPVSILDSLPITHKKAIARMIDA